MILGLGILIAAGLGCAAFGPLVRARVARDAAKRGLVVDVGRVRLFPAGVSLHDVEVRAPVAPSFSGRLQEVRVSLSWRGGLTGVEAVGGELRAQGPLAKLRKEVEAFDAERGSAGSAPAGGTAQQTPLRARELDLFVKLDDEGELELHGVQATKSTDRARLVVRDGSARRDGWTVSVRGAAVDAAKPVGRPWELAGVRTEALVLTVAAGGPAVEAVSPAGVAVATDRGLSPRLVERAKQGAERARGVAAKVVGLIPTGTPVQLEGVELSIATSTSTLHVGPNRLSLKSQRDRLEVELTPSAVVPGHTPLALEAAVPLDPQEPISVAVRGGPLPLTLLGLKDGDGGLLDVEKGSVEANARVTLSPNADTIKIEGGGGVAHLSLRHPALSTEPIRGLSGSFRLDGELSLDGTHLRIDRGELDVGTVHATLAGEATRTPQGNRVKGTYALPLASCQGVLDAMPAGLAPKLQGMKMSGMLAVKGAISFDGTNPAKAPSIDLDVVNECRVVSAPPEIAVARFRRPFKHQVYAPDGSKVEVESGPGTPNWVPMGAISPFVEAAVRTCEDGRFRTHRGFDFEAIRNSIRENVKAGRFVRGASTVSMQTVKNVWLDRDKTLGRKISEAVLTVYLEQELTKDEILELYLNDIEFGPMIYGIGPAAQHYFRTTPGALSLSQALYLGSILPSPKKSHFGEGGRLTPGRAKYLWLLMKMMEKRHLIDSAELAQGLTEIPVFGQSAPYRTGPVAGGEGDEPVDLLGP
jgi:hypothetical protein